MGILGDVFDWATATPSKRSVDPAGSIVHDTAFDAVGDALGKIQGERRAANPNAYVPALQPNATSDNNRPGHQPTPVLDYIRRQNPELSKGDARSLLHDFRQQAANPGLSEFITQNTNKVDPNTMQMFFAKTVQPYLNQVSNQYQAGGNAGIAAMQNILAQGQASGGGSPALDVLKQFLPVQAAGNQQMNAALGAATATAPYYDQLLSQLQKNIEQQQTSQYYQQQAAAAAAAGGGQQQGSSVGGQIAQLLAGKA